jgi:hypothetical protein
MALTYPTYSINGNYISTTTGAYPSTSTSTSSNTISANTFTTSGGTPVFTLSDGPPTTSLSIKGDIVMNGESLEDRLARIENMLFIPQRKLALEQKYEILRNAWLAYQEAADACKNWELLKGDD